MRTMLLPFNIPNFKKTDRLPLVKIIAVFFFHDDKNILFAFKNLMKKQNIYFVLLLRKLSDLGNVSE